VKGKVQGVAYRFNTMIKAQELGLNGYVKNDYNGDVIVEAEGDEEAVNKLIDWCQVGPPKAIVSELFAEEISLKDYKAFEIKR
jgi:acylphosphatase